MAAVAILLVVGVASGELQIKHRKVEKFAIRANQTMNGKGEVPQFLKGLDDR
ncbi:hypothetical protein G7085_17730 [Tessaracoccus sp. HDW20]|uniref:hypothetical protein n=1 Tax=Tessaracoccus coleopterorum TaxID=2714950 RepID=UPI0018D35113|nr:hypothetical protein [Tessaracoccus coleopterorum]NHB85787.1 hypothetical protein [Tessaracoccus coleopterorum]